MKTENQYLSDEELLNLIAQVEDRELVQAPGDLLTSVLQKAGETEVAVARTVQPERRAVPQRKRREFRRYCIRVVTSMAAAIVLVFLLPGLDSVRQEAELAKQTAISQQKEPDIRKEQPERKEQREESLTEKIGACRVIRDGQLLTIIKELGGK